MRRSFVVLALVTAVCVPGARSWAADAHAPQAPTGSPQAGTCVFTNYTLTGTFNLIGGTASFTLGASGGCLGTSPSVITAIDFTSVGPWSCVAGVARGGGSFQPSNGDLVSVVATLVNTGGEYVVELVGITGEAVGQFTTLPVPCVEGQTQTTIGGNGTLTFAA
jgi:hypothetical protein